MSWGGYVLMDPQDIERMFSTEDVLGSLPSIFEGPDEEAKSGYEDLRPLLDRIPPLESDFLDLYYFRKVRQAGIAELFNVSQPTVCYRLVKAAKRLKYLASLPAHDLPEIEKELRGVLSDDLDVKIMLGMLDSTCQSEVARSLGVSQGLVRHRFLRTLNKLRQMRGMETCIELFTAVSENFGVLRDTCRFEWDDEIIYSIF